MKARLIVAISVLLMSAAAVADGITWDQLSDEQRVVLRQFEDNFDDMPAERRERLSKGAERYATMTPQQREQAVVVASHYGQAAALNLLLEQVLLSIVSVHPGYLPPQSIDSVNNINAAPSLVRAPKSLFSSCLFFLFLSRRALLPVQTLVKIVE